MLHAPDEIWRPFVRFLRYEASSLGRVRNAETGRILRPSPTAVGYPAVTLCPGRHTVSVHTLVLEAFAGPRPAGHEASHLDGTRTNNRLDNLVWEPRAVNNRRRHAHGTMPAGDRHPRRQMTSCKHGHTFSAENTIRTASGHRQCRECGRRRYREYLVRRRAAKAAQRRATAVGA